MQITLQSALMTAVGVLASVISFLFMQMQADRKACEQEKTQFVVIINDLENQMRTELKRIADEATIKQHRSDSIAFSLQIQLAGINRAVKTLK